VIKDEVAKQAAALLYETALLESGFTLENPKIFASRIKSNLNVDPDAQVEEEADEVNKDGDTDLDDDNKNKLDLQEVSCTFPCEHGYSVHS
jgi:heat shock protein beta